MTDESLPFVDAPTDIDAFELGRQAIADRASNLPVSARQPNTGADNFEYVDKNLKEIVETGMGALHSLANLARSSESARVFEVLANMLKTMSEVNAAVIDNTKDKVALEAAQGAAPSGNTQNNVFIGSSADLNRYLEKLNLENLTGKLDINDRVIENDNS